MQYSIGEMAKLIGIAPSTLRYYDKEGLLPFLERSKSGTRVFNDTDYEFLKIVECLKTSGLPIKDIKEFISFVLKGDETIDDRLQLFHKQKQVLEKQMADLQETLDTINFKCWYYETAKTLGSTEAVEQLIKNELPADLQPAITRLRKESEKK
ncbi:MAG TPA: MerR family transcriptional regulator [Firmicutes bacterium]|nr:MerR family transcriptional regulator [Bacillota bacterium]